MKKKPVIGILPHYVPDDRRVHLNYTYVEAISENGGIPLILPIQKNISAYISRIDGLLMSGGGPGHVSEAKKDDPYHPKLRDQNPVRYDFEAFALKKALKKGIPIIGICRGHQMIAEVLGGSISLGIKGDFPEAKNHYQTEDRNVPTHNITINKRSRLYKILRSGYAQVNSFHRQSVKKVPRGFIISAVSEDGIIEAMESTRRPIMGFQFHPEALTHDRGMNRVFTEFIKRCR